ncbi:DUF3500 domain-containing protein [Spelaeicoccus albus]|uniref:DUF3500 domain-containing protein n=1 Tax=Spelaeicoccus albus TaxID=1280376 RepID=A0A7Z0A984_9MICO|nr:DUF3500 domain-containing protein [Spelaeicoccus albus]NYI66742.1 hypothetical protein [Spelaeicoccus albus]
MTGGFRRFVPPPDDPRITALRGLNAYDYREAAKNAPFTGDLIRGWQPLYGQPFRGMSADGEPRPSVHDLGPARPGEEAPAEAMTAAARALLTELPEDDRVRLCYPVDAVEWQLWANPEFMQHDTGLRLECARPGTRRLILDVVRASLSEPGYRLVRTLMRVNGFLGDLVELAGIMNEYSYNFAVFGTPSADRPWGWQLFGHHLAVNCLVAGSRMVCTPVFFGAEPNGIDAGPDAGTHVFTERIRLARALMQSLPGELADRARTYREMNDPAMPPGRVHPGDERHLAGAFQDNRVIPYEGIRVSEMSREQLVLVNRLVAEFTAYLPDGVAKARCREIAAWYDETHFSWIGGTRDDDPFYFRIQSPVVVAELDHHCGVFLTNAEPAPFHIHTVLRTPNGNDYGRAIVRAAVRTG